MSRSMVEYILSVLVLVLCTTVCNGESEATCQDFSYYSRSDLNDKTFSENRLEVLTVGSKYECFQKCSHHPMCNTLLTNPSTGDCELYSVSFADATFASSSPGLQYYAAGCRHAKTGIPTCEAEFAAIGDPQSEPSQCYSNSLWVNSPLDSHTCKRVEWINTTLNVIPLPSPLVPGLVLDIRGARKVDEELLCALRQTESSHETVLLRIFTDNRSQVAVRDGSTWQSTIVVDPFPVAAGEIFSLRVVFTNTQYQVTVNGNPYAIDSLFNPLNISAFMVMLNWDPLERVKFTYP